jgi:hypothetical protein
MTVAPAGMPPVAPGLRGRPPTVLTWHVHGTYLETLSKVPVRFIVPVKPGRPTGYGGRAPGRDWPENVVEVDAEAVRDQDIDVVLYQSLQNYEQDGQELLGDGERRLPRIHLEHDPPRGSPTDTRHPVTDPGVLLVHVTPFNDLMWDSGDVPTQVIDHGVEIPDAEPTFELERGIAAINDLPKRGRRLGLDVFERWRAMAPLDLAGMGSEAIGGLGALSPTELVTTERRYRVYCSPIRYTSLGLATLEAMALGLPVVGLATAELATVVENGRSGYIDTDVGKLGEELRRLILDPDACRQLGIAARTRVLDRFGMDRFRSAWLETFERVASRGRRTASSDRAA